MRYLGFMLVGVIAGIIFTKSFFTPKAEVVPTGPEVSHSENIEEARLFNLEGNEFDLEFIRLMIEHHEGAIEMAKLIPAKTDREELRTMGEDIIKVQSQEIGMMETWLDEWKEEASEN